MANVSDLPGRNERSFLDGVGSLLAGREGGTSRNPLLRTEMYDTVVASIEVDLTDETAFAHRSVVDETVRMWRNPAATIYEPRLTYWRSVSGGHGRLRIEFSVPKMAGADLLSNPNTTQVNKGLYAVNAFVWDCLSDRLPSIKEWQAQRIDYAWNFEPSGDVAQYITMLQGLWLGRMSRHPHPDSEGVVWKSRQPNHRWVKFYNKTREVGGTGVPVLRFEVSNYRRSLAYMCDHWLGCGRTVGDLLHPGRALYVMARMWSKLGLFSSSYHADGGLLLKLKALFGNGAASAFYALMCISNYGADAHKVYGLMSDNSYYAWKRKLSEHDLLVNSDVMLVPLTLPAVHVLKELQKAVPQNLRDEVVRHNVVLSKNLPKNWPFWAEVLQIGKTSPEIGRLTNLLSLSWEQLYGSDEARELERLRGAARQSRVESAVEGAAD